MSLAPIMIKKTPLFQITVIHVHSRQDEFQIDKVFHLAGHYRLNLSAILVISIFAWTTCVPCNVLGFRFSSHLDPASLSERCSHSRVPNLYTEIFLVLAWLKQIPIFVNQDSL